MDLKASVVNCYDFNRNAWDPRWRRAPNDWEMGELVSLLEMLGGLRPVSNNNDVWVWKPSHRGIFTPKSFYVESFHFSKLMIPYRTIWNPDIPSKVSFFI